MKNKLFIIVGVLIVMGVGVSFAYFMLGTSVEGTGAKGTTSTNSLMKVTYDAGNSKLTGTLNPKDILSKTFKINVTPNGNNNTVTYAIKFNIDTNTFVKCSDTNYNVLTNDCEKDAEELVYTLKDASGTVLKTGDLTGVTGEVLIIKETKTVASSTDYNYTLEVTFKDTGKDQNHNMNKTFSGEVKVEFAAEGISIPEVIASLNVKTETPAFGSTATTDEGVYRVSDGMYGGYSYYWRGAATNNYVQFAGYCWRIVRINGDGTMRLIYDGSSCHANGTNTTDSIALTSTAYNSDFNHSEYVGWKYTGGVQRPTSITEGTDAPIKTALESWYTTNIASKGYDAKVATGKFCNDRDVASGYTWITQSASIFYYAGYTRLYTNHAPTLSCASLDTYSLKVGLITADEVEFAGGKDANNTSYYLYNGQNYWTMSPHRWGANASGACVFRVDANGYLNYGDVDVTRGVRPVVNLVSTTIFTTGGIGTQSNPYVVS